ncbi:sulfite exporter TauE/SafE family protein [Actinoplanes sichuanensis]|uniref:Probable membrane transporter protein n=1 Tax=Actinoplanes sichuanensis TaxID=512349 RepID=A0ABW4ASX0_9ACTN|nr:sulfite exporter TauE/SafE family protein [Actinoplanes sichuanensis]BEL08518.1 sulfite exporter TauE/SafE family protein [Actinoplanes sichuanensis]
MQFDHAVLLLAGGVGSGLTGSMAGLASLISYPTLLAVGLPPIAANVTNSVGLLASGAGSAAGSRPELRGQGRRILRQSVFALLGGTTGAILLMNTTSAVFERIVPVLIGVAAVVLLMRDRLRGWYTRPKGRFAQPPLGLAIFLIGIYGGYFGAAAGVLMLAVMSMSMVEPLAVTNAVKSVVLGASNAAAAILYAFIAPVHWTAAALLGFGCLIGSWIGPALVRRTPERPLRIVIALAALGLAAYLWQDAGTS